MRISLSWLKDFLDTAADAETLSRMLTQLGHEVEAVEYSTPNVTNVRIGKVLEAVQHPNADRLRVCTVDVGEAAPRKIVCGAPNVRAGLTVAVAVPGAVLPGNFVIKQSKIRGEQSDGMICSQRELGIGDEHNGIWEMDVTAKPGTELKDALGEGDVFYTLKITPNRGDALSVLGLARDLAATGIGKLKPLACDAAKPGTAAAPKTPVLQTEGCPYFSQIDVSGVKNGESPAWLKTRLADAGLRPINTIVDIGNYVMLSVGQPLHMYDADKVNGALVATTAKGGETLNGLDGKPHTLNAGDLVITDGKTTLGLAGIVGGEESSVTEATTRIYIEAAQFSRSKIALTGQAHQIHSDARQRFERGIDPARTKAAALWAAHLVAEACGGTISAVAEAGTQLPAATEIAFDPAVVKTFGGLNLPEAEVYDLLARLGFTLKGKTLVAPTWFVGMETPEDVVEEVLRLKGYDAIPAELPALNLRTVSEGTPLRKFQQASRRHLAARGYLECINYSFIPQKAAEVFAGGHPSLQLVNPIDAATMRTLRPSLLPGLLMAANRNLTRGEESILLAEVGTTFTPAKGGTHKEATAVAVLRMGPNHPRHWHDKQTEADPFTLKAEALTLLEALGFDASAATFSTDKLPAWFHPGKSATITLGGSQIGTVGELHPATLKAVDVKGKATAMELSLSALTGLKPASGKFTLSAFQAVTRDFAFVVDHSQKAGDLLNALKGIDATLIRQASLFDVYAGDKLPQGKKSLAVSLTLQADDRTLTDADITTLADKVVAVAKEKFGAELR